jgi:hypothetical protein
MSAFLCTITVDFRPKIAHTVSRPAGQRGKFAMQLLQQVARWELIILGTSFGGVTLWKLFATGNLTGLIRAEDKTVSPGRVQLLFLTVLVALQYLLTTIHDPSHMPAIPSNLVAALGGSQFVYLGAKAWNSSFGPKA